MGFVKGRGIRSNAQFHVGKRLILNIDLANFFGSIHAGRVRRRLMVRPYVLTDDVATTIAKLCTLNDFLPTGAPTSPILANIVSSALDGALTEFARANGCFYTRYADDITFSTNRRVFPKELVRRADDDIAGVHASDELVALIKSHGFTLQPSKTRLMNRDMRQEVCGVTCNVRLNVRRELYREIRGAMNAWRKYGLDLATQQWKAKFNWRNASDFERSLRGRIEHLIHIRGQNDSTVFNIVQQFNGLPGRTMKDVSYEYSVKDPLGIMNSVGLVDCADEDDPNALRYSQGSAFVVDGGAVVTNHHVIAYRRLTKKGFARKGTNGKILPMKIFPEIRVSFGDNAIPFDMVVVYADEVKDLAVLRPADMVWNTVFVQRAAQVAFGVPATGDRVSLVGYPSHSPGGSCKIAEATITGTTPMEGQDYFTISQIIVQGNSGGPVVDRFGQVIGVATKGISPTETVNLAFNGCIPMHTIDKAIFTSS